MSYQRAQSEVQKCGCVFFVVIHWVGKILKMVTVISSPTFCSCSVPGKNWLGSIVTFVPTLFVFWKILLSWVIFCLRLWRAHLSFLKVSQSQQSWATESHLVVNAKKTGFVQLLSRVRSVSIVCSCFLLRSWRSYQRSRCQRPGA